MGGFDGDLSLHPFTGESKRLLTMTKTSTTKSITTFHCLPGDQQRPGPARRATRVSPGRDDAAVVTDNAAVVTDDAP